MIGNPAARKFCKAGDAIRNSFDYAEGEGRSAETGKKNGQDRRGGFVAPIGEEACHTDAEYASGQPFAALNGCVCLAHQRKKCIE